MRAPGTGPEGCHFRVTALTCADADWQAGCCGGPYGGVDTRPAGAGRTRARSDAGRERDRDRGSSASGGGAESAGGPAAIHAGGPDAAGHPGEAAATRAVAGLPGRAVDAAALAPRAGGPPLDVPAHWSRRL